MCSGADTDLLEQSPKSEQIKYAGVGGTVFFTALMAFIASAYALYTVFDHVWLALLFGLLWGLLIFNLDRFIVSTIKKSDNKRKEFLQAAPRIALAIIIAVLIAKPLELKIFEKEIDQVLLEQKNDMLLANQEQVKALYSNEINQKNAQIAAIENALAKKEAEVKNYYDTFISEAEGTAGTGLVGKGPVYKEKREKYDQALAELATLKGVSEAKKEILFNDLLALDKAEKDRIAATDPVVLGFDGLMARINALNQLPWLPSFFIFLLFLAIETSPVFAKLLSPKGEYDIRLAEAEQRVWVWAEQKKRQRAAMLQTDTTLNERVYASLAEEDESYHYKKQKARAILHFQTDAFMKEQEKVVSGV